MCTSCNPQPNLSRRGFFGRAAARVYAAPLPDPVEMAPGLSIYPREAWAGEDRPPTGELYPESIYFLVMHHSDTDNEYSNSEVVQQIQNIYDYDTGPDRGWPDVGFNFFVDRFGRIFEGRSGSLKGPVLNDEVGGNAGWSQQVCLLGTFDTEQPSAEALDSLTKLLSWLADRHKLDVAPGATATVESRGSDKIPAGQEFTVNTLAGHRDVSETSCPGDTFYSYVIDTLPQMVVNYRESLANPSTTSPVTESTAPTADTSSSTPTSAPDGSTPGSPVSTPTTIAGTAESNPPTTQPVTVGSAGSSAVGPLLSGVGSGAGVVAIVTGIGWVIQRRRSNGL